MDPTSQDAVPDEQLEEATGGMNLAGVKPLAGMEKDYPID